MGRSGEKSTEISQSLRKTSKKESELVQPAVAAGGERRWGGAGGRRCRFSCLLRAVVGFLPSVVELPRSVRPDPGLGLTPSWPRFTGEASVALPTDAASNKPISPPPFVFLVVRVLLLYAPPGRPWWQGGVARRSGGLVALPSRPAEAARERGLAQPPLLLAGETALSCLVAASSLHLLPWRHGGGWFVSVEVSACVDLRAAGSLSLSAYGGCCPLSRPDSRV
jgi:hypothetical protein